MRILPRDIGFLHADQKAEVKFTAYDFAIYGGLEGKVEQIGADTVTDEKAIRTTWCGSAPIAAPWGQEPAHHPGIVAEVHILTGKRTVLQYLLKPVLRAKANAFTER